MKKGNNIIYIFIPVLAGLLCLLGWNCSQMYRLEKKRVQEKVESSINSAADAVQWYNGSLTSNYALMQTDKDYESKIAFAAGFTQNRGKISVYFGNEEDKANLPVKSPAPDCIPAINKQFLAANHIEYNPSKVMTSKHFDSLFKIELRKNKVVVPYKIQFSKRTDSATNDSIISSQFILNFFAPHIYCVHYTIPVWLVVRGILPYLASTLLLSILLVLGTLFYYRSYRMQIQQSQFKESLVSNITHELKTPLTSLQLIIDSAQKGVSDNDTVSLPSKHIQFAENELNRMKLIVDKVLSFTKMSRDQFTFNKERVGLDHVIMESLAVMEINIQQAKGVVNYEGDNKVTILGDPILLVNAISTIIDNALKYTGRPPVIDIRLAQEGQYAIIAIQDNGIGIPHNMAKKIFEPFFRIPTGNVYNAAGHGLGLSFVKQVMKLHDGLISFVSNEEGTTFYLKFKVS